MPSFTAIQLGRGCRLFMHVYWPCIQVGGKRKRAYQIYLGSLSFIFSSSYVGAGKEAKWLGRYDSHIRLSVMYVCLVKRCAICARVKIKSPQLHNLTPSPVLDNSLIGSHYFHAISCPLSHDPPRGWG